jgi:serine/threonine-protein phosphatase 2B catalytic subunit
VIRAHEAQVDGYKMQMVNRSSGIPRVITIFSAPNYCDVYKNKAACLKFDNNVLNIKQFVETTHPYYLPNFMDVFQWSLPFVAEKVTDMLHSMMEYGSEEDDGKMVANHRPHISAVIEQRGTLLRKKIIAMAKMVRVFKMLREQNDAVVRLKQLSPSRKLPHGLLQGGVEELYRALSDAGGQRRAGDGRADGTVVAAHGRAGSRGGASTPTAGARTAPVAAPVAVAAAAPLAAAARKPGQQQPPSPPPKRK